MAIKYTMDFSIEGARVMADAALKSSKALNESVYDIRHSESDAVFVAYRAAVADALMVMLTDILNPIYAKYPDLKPPGWV